MHDTAYEIGTLAMHIYADLAKAAVLEIGSQAVNGSLRANALPTTRYVGADLEDGEGVDLVVEPGKPLPLDADSFDLVLASSVFEHDPAFWLTFLEMCRVTKVGGYVYINAPSNGIVHRYPMDNWRFYPDAGKALASWAASQGQAMTLVESFVANRQNDIWNDFVAVFRKGRLTRNLPKIFLHQQIACTNVLTWRTRDILAESNAPEDMILLSSANDRATAAEQRQAEALKQRDGIEEEKRRLEARVVELEQLAAELRSAVGELEQAAGHWQTEVCTRDAAIQQLRDDAGHSAEDNSRLRAQLVERDSTIAQLHCDARQSQLQRQALHDQINELEHIQKKLEAQVSEHSTKAERLARQLATKEREAELEAERLFAQSELSNRRVRELEDELSNLRMAVARLKRDLKEERQVGTSERSNSDWLQKLSRLLLSTHGKWPLLPRAARVKRLHELLRQHGLFDAAAYSHRYTDAAEEQFEPLHHYLAHGIGEGRSRAPRADGAHQLTTRDETS